MLELLGRLSLVTDIGTGSPLEESLKRCLVAGRLAKIIGCTDSEVSDVLYTALLQHLGCTAYAHEVARVWGDDIVTTRVMFLRSSGQPADLGVSSAIWDDAAPLNTAEREQARLHPYHSERILARIPSLAGLATLAGQHHERSDGTGYHRGATAAQLSMSSGVLACADAYRSMIEDRPQHDRRSPASKAIAAAIAADRLEADAKAGRFDAHAAGARY
jgi:HD domain